MLCDCSLRTKRALLTTLWSLEVSLCVCSAVVSHHSGDCNDGDNSCICPAGGSIVSTRCSESYQTKAALLSLFGIPLWYFSQSPRTVIQVGFHLFFLNPT